MIGSLHIKMTFTCFKAVKEPTKILYIHFLSAIVFKERAHELVTSFPDDSLPCFSGLFPL